MAALPDCPHMPRKCAHYDPTVCKDPASRMCHYVQNTINSAVSARAALAPLRDAKTLTADSATRRYLAEIEAFLLEMGV